MSRHRYSEFGSLSYDLSNAAIDALRLPLSPLENYRFFWYFNHPLANSDGKVLFHRFITSIREQRWLEKNESVYFIDRDRTNFSPDNFLIRKRKLPDYRANQRRKPRIEFYPDPKFLAVLVWSMASTTIADRYHVSDKLVEKRCKQYGIQKPPRGYWAKIKQGTAPITALLELGHADLIHCLPSEKIAYD